MKKISFLMLLAILAGSTSLAKIWRVNNVAGINADFTTAQAAHDNLNVQAGDTLHIEPSTVNYGSLTMTKRLTVISIGDFFGTNTDVQYSPLTGRLTSVFISNDNANGSVLHCNLTGNVSLNGVSNIRIERCHIGTTSSFTNSSGISVINNYLNALSLGTGTSSVVVSNNIFEFYVDMSSSASAKISNNVFKATTGTASTIQIYNSTFENNIINKTGLTVQFFSSIVQNNISSNTTLPAGSGNINSAVMTNIFVDPSGSDDISFRLQTAGANPATGAGFGGIDCGAFGGSSPYKPGLQAAVPAIYKIVAPVTPSGNTMNVQFSTRSNN